MKLSKIIQKKLQENIKIREYSKIREKHRNFQKCLKNKLQNFEKKIFPSKSQIKIIIIIIQYMT